jgi:hypothetical protein
MDLPARWWLYAITRDPEPVTRHTKSTPALAPRGGRFDHPGAQMLVHDGGLDVGDLGALGQPVDDKGIEPFGVGDRDVDQELAAAGGDETRRSSPAAG